MVDHHPPSITYHVDADDLAVALLDLPELGQEVPEPRLGDDLVGREDAHAVQLGRGVGLRGQIAPDDLVLGETPYYCQLLDSTGLIDNKTAFDASGVRYLAVER